MTFSQFLNKIIECFNLVFKNIISYIELLMENNFIKIIIYINLLMFIISILCVVVQIIYNVLNYKHDKEANDLENTDAVTNENVRVKKKDLWW